jgi:tetratricopeptide (TPR) repeat protein
METVYDQFRELFLQESKSRDEVYRTPRRPPGSRSWIKLRIFCSSTFKDMLVERYVIKNFVLPDLEKWSRKYFIEIVLVDLSWGILEGSSAATTIDTCLSEINNSQIFLYLGGQRYGWAPSISDIGEELAEKYDWKDGCSVTAMEVLHGALRNNNPNAIFCMRDIKHLHAIPEDERVHFHESEEINEMKQCALLDTIVETKKENCIFYNPSEDTKLSSPLGNRIDSESVEKDEDYCEKTSLKSASCSVIDEEAHIPRLEDIMEGTYGGSWQKFADLLTERLKIMISSQYYIEDDESNMDEYTSARLSHKLYGQMLVDKSYARTSLLDHAIQLTKSTTQSMHGRLIVLEGPSGRGKSSLIASIANTLESDKDKNYKVISYFIGSSERSDELGYLARFLSAELKALMGITPEMCQFPDDEGEACAQSKHLLMTHTISEELVVIVDAINQLQCAADHKLAWLPEKESISLIPKGTTIIVTCTPGQELDELLQLTELAGTSVHVGPLNEDDKVCIASGLLSKYSKLFTDHQMQCFLLNPGSSNPLWQTVAMFYLRSYALFETLSDIITQLPSDVSELIGMVLNKAEERVGERYLRIFLLSVTLSKQGLKENEALNLLPILLYECYPDEYTNPKVAGTGNPINMYLWSHMLPSLDVLLQHTSSSIYLSPAHGIIKEAILERYEIFKSDACVMSPHDFQKSIIQRNLGNYFEHTSHCDMSRKTMEITHAYINLKDIDSMSRFLCSDKCILHHWYQSGDSGKWHYMELWKNVDTLIEKDEKRMNKIDKLESSQHLFNKALSLATDIEGDNHFMYNFRLIRAIFECLLGMRKENISLDFLVKLEQSLQKNFTESDVYDVSIAWTHSSMAETLQDLGKYNEAIDLTQQALREYALVPHLYPHRCIASAQTRLGRLFDLVEKWDDALESLQQADETFKATAVTKSEVFSNKIIGILLDDTELSETSIKTDEADTMKEIANIYLSLKRYDDALECYTKAKSIYTRYLGENHPKTARALWGYGIVQYAMKSEIESIETYKKVLEKFMICFGSNHCDTADMLYNIAQSYKSLSQWDESIQYYTQALQVYMKILGPDHRDIGFTYQDMGETYALAGNSGDAKTYFENAYRIRLKALGEYHDETIESKQSLQSVIDQKDIEIKIRI